MIVKNIVLSDRELFMEYLVRDLIKHQINYVQIENEFHFLNHIYRFYDINKDIMQISKFINDNLFNEFEIVSSFLDVKVEDPNLGVTIIDGSVVRDFSKKNHNSSNMKKMLKRQNRMVNQKLSQIKR